MKEAKLDDLAELPHPPPAAGAATSPSQWGRASGLLLVAEELGTTPDEGYVRFVRTLESQLGARRPLLVHLTPETDWDRWTLMRTLARTWQVVRAASRPELGSAPPGVVVYASRSALTLPALIRARLLRRLCGAPVAMVALQQMASGSPSARTLRRLAPDLLLVPTERERDAARALGIRAAAVSSGVDLRRFRPPEPGEKEALRRRWAIPAGERVLLHVGHLREGRNLQALTPLASLPGVTVVLVASQQRGPESAALLAELQSKQVVVIDGYRPDVEELYRLADCYVFPTVLPGHAVATPLSVLEALASDLPVVSTRFGALPERFRSAHGLFFVESVEELPEQALLACRTAARTRHLAEPYSWDAVVDRLVALLDDVRLERQAGREAGRDRLAAAAARLRRAVEHRKNWPRELLWPARVGYRPRWPAADHVVRVEQPEPLPALHLPPSGRVGVVGAGSGSGGLAGIADFLGLSVESSSQATAPELLDRAARERWGLLTVERLASLPETSRACLAAFVRRGGTVYLEGLAPQSNRSLRQLAADLGIPPPHVRRGLEADRLLIPAEQARFARELAGTILKTGCGPYALDAASSWEVLAFALSSSQAVPAVAQLRVGLGRIVLSALERPSPSRLSDLLAPSGAGAALVRALLLRQVFGRAAWHAPALLANLTIDDPALRLGSLGLRYDLLTAQALDHGFHVTIATVPRELGLAEPAVVRRLRDQPELLSACYHGCDHSSYEFYLTRGSRTRYAPRSLEEQRSALRRAVEHGRRFASTHGCSLDRVMVFPYGVGPASIFPDLHRLGFLATCNYGDKYPLEASVPARPDLGLRPADLAWEGFPLLWRRGLGDSGYLLDLVLGRPVLFFTHPRRLGSDFGPLVKQAQLVNRVSRGTAAWRSLDQVACHAYLQRCDPASGWEVLMTANEACLHNPGPAPRTYAVRRPERPGGSRFEVDGRPHDGDQPLSVTVPAAGTALVRLVADGSLIHSLGAAPPGSPRNRGGGVRISWGGLAGGGRGAQAGPPPCSVFETGAEGPLTAPATAR